MSNPYNPNESIKLAGRLDIISIVFMAICIMVSGGLGAIVCGVIGSAVIRTGGAIMGALVGLVLGAGLGHLFALLCTLLLRVIAQALLCQTAIEQSTRQSPVSQ